MIAHQYVKRNREHRIICPSCLGEREGEGDRHMQTLLSYVISCEQISQANGRMLRLPSRAMCRAYISHGQLAAPEAASTPRQQRWGHVSAWRSLLLEEGIWFICN